MKTNIAHKKGFTIVELVIVIAVIAILAAVLIPTFVNLVQKANDAAALADARNMANQLLINLLEHDAEGAKDLLVIQKKADGIYVHAYSASEGRVIAYKNNPVSIDELKELATTPETAAEDGETAEPDEAEQYAGIVETLLLKLQSEAAIQLCDPQPAEDDWSHPNQMPTIVETLGYNNSEIAFRTNYVVIVTAFENITIDPEHKCSKDTLTHYDAQEATCTLAGRAEYWMCTECGKLFSDADATTEIDDIKITPALGHDWKDNGIVTDSTCTAEGVKNCKCSRCDATTTATISKKEHSAVTDRGYAATCTKDGLTDGTHCSACDKVLTKQEIIKATGHTSVTDAAVAATCTKAGLTEGSHCSVCNEVLTAQQTVDALGHEYDENHFCKHAPCQRYEYTVVMKQDASGKVTLTIDGKKVESGTLLMESGKVLTTEEQKEKGYFANDGVMYVELDSNVTLGYCELCYCLGSAEENVYLLHNLDLDLNGHTMTLNAAEDNKHFYNESYLTTEDEVKRYHACVIETIKGMTVRNGTLKLNENNRDYAFTSYQAAKYNFINCTVVKPDDMYLYCDMNDGNSTVTIMNSTLKSGNQTYTDDWTKCQTLMYIY